LLIVDEFSALASSAGMAARVEQARGFNAGLVLAPQVIAGMGDETEAARITGSVETVISHRVNTPEAIIALAGTRQGMEYSTQFAAEGATGAGSARSQHQFKVDPNKVRGLDPGVAFLISRGRAMKIQVPRAPTLSAPLPEIASQAPARFTADGLGEGSPEKNLPGSVPLGGGLSEKGARTLPF
jgi:hypothetical protein